MDNTGKPARGGHFPTKSPAVADKVRRLAGRLHRWALRRLTPLRPIRHISPLINWLIVYHFKDEWSPKSHWSCRLANSNLTLRGPRMGQVMNVANSPAISSSKKGIKQPVPAVDAPVTPAIPIDKSGQLTSKTVNSVIAHPETPCSSALYSSVHSARSPDVALADSPPAQGWFLPK